MNDLSTRIEQLDTTLFNRVFSETSVGDRRALLAVQRAVRRAHGRYAYLEIGSHLGGTIQPHLADDRCSRIYSIDPRPAQTPDDRLTRPVVHYEDNSSESMLRLLAAAGLGDVRKIVCIELDASQIDPGRIEQSPLIAFIDGEHTNRAVLSDFEFCSRIISADGVILFHDFLLTYEAILAACGKLRKTGAVHFPVRLADNVFAIFFDRDLLVSDSYLSGLWKSTGRSLFPYRVKAWLKQVLPGSAITLIRGVRGALKARAA